MGEAAGRFRVRSVLRGTACLQTVWVGTLAVGCTERSGLRWQRRSVFLCHRQLCTAVLVCAREEERTCQRITEEPSISPNDEPPSPPPLPPPPSDKIYTPCSNNAALIYPVSLCPLPYINTHLSTVKHLICLQQQHPKSSVQTNHNIQLPIPKKTLQDIVWSLSIICSPLQHYSPLISH